MVVGNNLLLQDSTSHWLLPSANACQVFQYSTVERAGICSPHLTMYQLRAKVKFLFQNRTRSMACAANVMVVELHHGSCGQCEWLWFNILNGTSVIAHVPYHLA
jgi:hypothetical protein